MRLQHLGKQFPSAVISTGNLGYSSIPSGMSFLVLIHRCTNAADRSANGDIKRSQVSLSLLPLIEDFAC